MNLFKRNKPEPPLRRQTPNVRAPIFSYYTRPQSSTGDPQETKVLNNRQNRYAWWQLLPTYIALMIFAVSSLYLLSLDPHVKVAQFINPAQKQYLRDITVYQTAATAAFQRSILNRNKLTADTIQISREIKDQFPELSNVGITLPLFGRKPVLEFVPATPVLLLNARNGAFALDKTGRALVSANDAPGLSAFTLPQVTDEAGVTINTGASALPEDNVTFILEIIGQLKAKSLDVDTLTLPSIVNEFHIRLKNTPYFIKLNTEGDARQQIGTYVALREKLEADGTSPKEYIDVRVDEKAYYK